MSADIIERLKAQRKCRRCDCLSCGREGAGELHDHVCTDGDGCVETRQRLRSRVSNLRHLSFEALDEIGRLRSALAAAEARGEERMRERAAAYIEAGGFDNTIRINPERDTSVGDWFNRQRAAGIRALPFSTPEKQTEAAPASNGEAG